MSSHRLFFSLARLLAVAVAAALCVSNALAASWKEKVLYSFQGIPDGAYPTGVVAFDKAGNMYGVTGWGGSASCPGIAQCGTVYQLQAPIQKGGAWTENVLYIFKGKNSNDGETPEGGLIFDQAGNLYGTTAYGGAGGCALLGTDVGCGTVFKLTPPKKNGGKWTETVIYSFQGDSDGYVPQGDLIFDSAGNLYGATQFGGGHGATCNSFYQFCGTTFELSPPQTKGGKWKEQVLYSFKGSNDGANPNGGLFLDSKGTIYGTTSSGGDQVCKGDGYVGCGTVYQLIPPLTGGARWTEKILHRFAVGFPNGGATPNGGLVADAKGRLYGTTVGGASTQNGVAFRLAKVGARWTEAIVRTFQNLDGRESRAGMIFDLLGNLYGTTSGGGSTGNGTIFELRAPRSDGGKWAFGLLHTFAGPPDGEFPAAKLVLNNAGKLYGTTRIGGDGQGCQGGCGVVFEFVP